jgi:hypothetical protein
LLDQKSSQKKSIAGEKTVEKKWKKPKIKSRPYGAQTN